MHNLYPDLKEKEKIFGGLLTMSQVGWIAGGAVTGVIVCVLLLIVVGKISFILLPVFIAAGCVFAFRKVNELTLFRYLRLKQRYKTKNHEFANRRQCKTFSATMILEDEEEQ